MKSLISNVKEIIIKNYNFIFCFFLIFILIILIMPPNKWYSNEEQYLGYVWRNFSPDSLVRISALRDTANHRFLYDTIAGFGISHIGFDWTHALGRIIVAILYSASLVYFFRSFGLSNIASCTIILTFVWLGEDILGKEWLFRGFEPKNLAYPFVFFSFSTSLKNRFGHSYLFLTLATYFHFLVGGFWFLITWLSQLYWTRNLKQTFLDSCRYFILCAPLFGMIGIEQLQNQDNFSSNLPASWIYSYFRAPHHVAPFASLSQFKSLWYKGVVFLFCLTITSVILYRSGNKNEREFSKLILALHIYLIFSLLISYFDKNGVLGKFYLFRPSSVTLLLTLCLYGLFLKNRISENSKQISFIALVLISSLTIPTLQGHEIIYKRVESVVLGKTPIYSPVLAFKDFLPGLRNSLPGYKNEYSELEKIIQSSNKTDIFLIDPKIEMSYLSFERNYNRPTLVFHKFVPTTASDIVRWYNLLKMRDDLFNKGCPSDITNDYSVRFLIVDKNNNSVNICGQEIYRDRRVKLIELEN